MQGTQGIRDFRILALEQTRSTALFRLVCSTFVTSLQLLHNGFLLPNGIVGTGQFVHDLVSARKHHKHAQNAL